MDMGTAGIAAGLGGQKYHLVLLFETPAKFQEFITDGWEATASANAVAGESGANVATNFEEGVVIYPLTDAGLMLNADISGTRFWVDEEINADAGLSTDESMVERDSGIDDDNLLDNDDVLENEREYELDQQ
jgi:lipid-binding SYLF domain-containing protein